MKNIAYSLLLTFASLEPPLGGSALAIQPGPTLTYEEFDRLPLERREKAYTQLSAETKAAFLRKRFEQWLAQHRGQLSSSQIAAVQEAINLVTPELFERAPNAEERQRQDAVSKKLRCSLGAELAYSFAQGEAAPAKGERSWTQVVHSWTEWVVDCVMK